MPIAQKIGLRLKKFREGCNLNIAVFAKSLGIGQSSLSKIENGQSAPSAKTLIAAYEKFQIDPLWLLTGESKNKDIESQTALKIGIIADKLPEDLRQVHLAAIERDLLLHKMLEEQRKDILKASSE